MSSMIRWFEETGNMNDVVVFSRVRLARNLKNYNFSYKLSVEDARNMIENIRKRFFEEDDLAEKFYLIDLDELDTIELKALEERKVISGFLAERKNAYAFVSHDEKMGVMVNEEDHIRIQALHAGMSLEEAFGYASKLDDRMSEMFEYAFDEELGYLTSCPTNVGTGLRASCMLHLPALTNSKKIQGIIDGMGHFGVSMKVISQEANLYQVSNIKTLGLRENEIINNVKNVVTQIVEQERKARRYYISHEKLKMEDEVYKSYGVLKYSRKMTEKDADFLLSELRMGLSEGLITTFADDTFMTYQIMMGIKPNNLQMLFGKELNEEEIQVERAKFIRENLPQIS